MWADLLWQYAKACTGKSFGTCNSNYNVVVKRRLYLFELEMSIGGENDGSDLLKLFKEL